MSQRAIMTFILCVIVMESGFSQQGTKGDSLAPPILMYVEQMPEFAGGQKELMKYLGSNLQYPPDARANHIEGRVVSQFVVDERGDISDVRILRGLYPSCDSEVIRVIAGMPKWKPGKQNDKAVKVYFKLPVTFKLSEPDLTQPGLSTPSYAKGEDSLKAFIQRNLQYPKEAKKKKIEGTVTLSFDVDENGKAQNIKVYKDLGYGTADEAIRILKLIPEWRPGTKEGKAVSMPYYMEVEFKLEKKK